jgi:hypothetical protein
VCDEDEVNTMDVRMRLGDAIDPCHLANGFEAVIGYECQEWSNPPFSHPHDTYNTCQATVTVFKKHLVSKVPHLKKSVC